jgi:hypothetical protein
VMITSNRLYDVLKYTAQIVLPAMATFYFALSQIWGLPHGAEVVGTIAAVDTFLGVLLGINTAQYNKSGAKYDGTVYISEDDDTKRFNLELDSDPYELEIKDEVVFRVNSLDKPS